MLCYVVPEGDDAMLTESMGRQLEVERRLYLCVLVIDVETVLW